MPLKNLTLKAFARIVWADLGVDHGHGFATIQPGSRNRVSINEIQGIVESLEPHSKDGELEYALDVGHGSPHSPVDSIECTVVTSEKELLTAIERIVNVSTGAMVGASVRLRSGPQYPATRGDSSVVLFFQYEGESDDVREGEEADYYPPPGGWGRGVSPRTLRKAKTAELVRLARPSAAHSLTVSKAAQAELKRRGRDHHGKKR